MKNPYHDRVRISDAHRIAARAYGPTAAHYQHRDPITVDSAMYTAAQSAHTAPPRHLFSIETHPGRCTNGVRPAEIAFMVIVLHF